MWSKLAMKVCSRGTAQPGICGHYRQENGHKRHREGKEQVNYAG